MRISGQQHPVVSAAVVAVLTLMGMIVFQAAKRLIHPGITLNQSDAISVCAATALAALLTYVVLRHRARLEKDLRREIGERIRVEKQLHQVSETEKRKLGRDLHDGLGQHLAGIEYSARPWKRNWRKRGFPKGSWRPVWPICPIRRSCRPGSLAPVDAGGERCRRTPIRDRETGRLYVRSGWRRLPVRWSGPVAVNDPFAATPALSHRTESVTNAIKHDRLRRSSLICAPQTVSFS
jgi:hypothetical protein